MAVRLKTHVEIPARVSPLSGAIPEGAIFEAPQSWFQERAHSPILETLTVQDFYAAAWAGDVINVDPDEVPARYRPEPEDEPESDEDEEGLDLSEADLERARTARERLEEQMPEILETLPEEPPGGEADATLRILYALLGTEEYGHRQTVLADTSERSARGTTDEIEARLFAELYDRQLAE